MSRIQDGNGAGLVEFLDYVRDRGLMKTATANSYRAAAKKVMEIDEDWESISMSDLDVEEQNGRFARLRGGNYTPASLRTYQARFGKALEMYRDYLHNPAGFRPAISTREPSGAKGLDTPKKRPAQTSGSTEPSTSRSDTAHSVRTREDERLITYPFPLASGQMAYVQLPRQFPRSEAERLSAFIASIAIDSPSSAEPG